MVGELPSAVAGTLTETAMDDEQGAYPQPGRSLLEQCVLLALTVPGGLARCSPAEARYGYFGDEATWSG